MAGTLVAAGAAVTPTPHDIFNNTGSYVHPKERFGNLSDKELQLVIDQTYRIPHSGHIDLVGPDGEWTTRRHHLNDRGDESSILHRQKSVEEVGILGGIRSGPWLIPLQLGSRIVYSVLHWATLLEGAERAYTNDPLKSNKALQLSVQEGLGDCKVFHPQCPDDVIRWLVDLGNSVNAESTVTTLLQVFRSTNDIEAGWKRKKQSCGWTTTSVGQSKLDEKKYLYIQGLHRKRWPSYRNYEVCYSFYKEALHTPLSDTTVWDSLVAWMQQNCDFGHPAAHAHAALFQGMYDIIRILKKNHVDYIVPMIGLMLPNINPLVASSPLSKSGLGNPPLAKITEEMVLQTLCNMKGSAAAEHLRTSIQNAPTSTQPTQPGSSSKHAQAKARRTQKKEKVAGSKGGSGSVRNMPAEIEEGALDTNENQVFLEHLSDLVKYLQEIDAAATQRQKIESFRIMALKAALDGVINVDFKTPAGIEVKKVSKWNTLRKMMNADVYRCALLTPRRSDVDFLPDESWEPNDGTSNNTGAGVAEESLPLTPEQGRSRIEELKDTICAMLRYLQQNNPNHPPIAHMSAASALNNTMIAVLTKASSIGGLFPDRRAACMFLATSALQEVDHLMPESWNEVCNLTELLRKNASPASGCKLIATTDELDSLLAFGISELLVFLLRIRLAAHILSSLGLQQFMHSEGLATVKSSYLPPLIHRAVNTLSQQYSPTDGSSTPNGGLFDAMLLSKKSFRDFMLVWMECTFDIHDHCVTFDGKAFAQRKHNIRDAVASLTCEAIPAALKAVGLRQDLLPDAKLDIFPSIRAEFAAKAVEQFEDENQDLLLAERNLQDPAAQALGKLRKLFQPVAIPATSCSSTVADCHKTDELCKSDFVNLKQWRHRLVENENEESRM